MARKGTRSATGRASGEKELEHYSPFVVRGVMKASGLTVSTLARRADRSHQSISNLVAGKTMKRAYPTLLKAVAAALDVDVALLKNPPLEFIGRLLHPFRDFEHNYSVWTALEAQRVIDRAIAASVNDLARLRDSGLASEPAYDSAVPQYVRVAFGLPFTIRNQRGRLLRPFGSDPHSYLVSPTPDTKPGQWRAGKDPAHETAIVQLIQSTAFVLAPWLSGAKDVGFNYLELRRITLDAMPQSPRFGDVLQIGTDWLPSYRGLPAPAHRCTDDDPYVLLNLKPIAA